MRGRCNNPRNAAFKYYGGRGIKVCDEWKSFEQFLADMGPKPNRELSLDRINNNGDYEPSNCRWATKIEQMKNRRKWGSQKTEDAVVMRRLKEVEPEIYNVLSRYIEKTGYALSTVGARLINDARIFDKIMKGRRVYYETRLKLRTAIKAELRK
jgi:hypothetical protein